MALEILFILLLIVANGIFSGSEIAIVSARKVRLQQLADKGSRPARIALRLAETPNDFLSTVQIGITLIGVLSGAVAGATVAGSVLTAIAFPPSLAKKKQLKEGAEKEQKSSKKEKKGETKKAKASKTPKKAEETASAPSQEL